MADNQFKIGDIVKIKGTISQAPNLTVFSIGANGMIVVIWFVHSTCEYRKLEVPPEALEIAS